MIYEMRSENVEGNIINVEHPVCIEHSSDEEKYISNKNTQKLFRKVCFCRWVQRINGIDRLSSGVVVKNTNKRKMSYSTEKYPHWQPQKRFIGR